MAALRQYRHLQRLVELEAEKRPAADSPVSTNANPTGTLTIDNAFTVEFTSADSTSHPRQWSPTWKTVHITIIWLMVFITGWSSAADATAHTISAPAFHVSQIAESLATSMFLWGVAFGALLAGPCSDSVGRLPMYIGTFLGFLIWTLASAVAPSFGAQIVFRGLAGLFASTTMSIYGGTLADLLEEAPRAVVWPFFALSPLLGPTIAPIANGWIAQNLGPRWIDWVTLIISGVLFVAALVLLPETNAATILSHKAAMVRRITGDERYRSQWDNGEKLSRQLRINLIRIIHFIVAEPTTVLFGLYLTVLYVLIFGFLEGFDFIFTNTYSFDIGQRYSAFAAIAVGILLGLPFILTFTLGSDRDPNDLEHRLRPSLFASPLLAISLFWIGWTDRSSISYWSPLGACCLFGFALTGLFTPTYHYLLDTYGVVSSSALSAVTFARYLASGGIVIATQPLYKALSVEWTLTFLGCVAVILAPVPWAFYFFGPSIRRKSKWAQH